MNLLEVGPILNMVWVPFTINIQFPSLIMLLVKFNYFFIFSNLKEQLLMEFQLWNISNAINQEKFSILAINNLISQENGGLKFNSK